VITTATSLRRGFDFERIDRQGNLNLIEAAEKEKVGHFVFTSTTGADAPDAPRIFQNKKFIEDRLAASGLRHTALRPAGFMENLIPLVRFARRMGVAVIPGSGRVKTSYIAVRDVAELARFVLVHPPAGGSVIEFGGPEDLSLLDCVAKLEQALGRRIRLVHLPLQPVRSLARAMRPFSPGPEAFVEILEFVERNGLRADRRFLAAYPIQLTSFRRFLSQQLVCRCNAAL
jgi:NADH dehydrogenase